MRQMKEFNKKLEKTIFRLNITTVYSKNKETQLILAIRAGYVVPLKSTIRRIKLDQRKKGLSVRRCIYQAESNVSG